MTKTKRYIIQLGIIGLVCLCLTIFLLPCGKYPLQIIAHGGGEIDGFRIPNCVEAVEHSLENGVKYIELDLQLTSDSQLVALHDWRTFHSNTGHEGDSLPVTYKEFKSRRLFDKYVPITGGWIDSLLNFNDTVVLVTDKISDPLIINKWLFRYRSRVIVECFSMADYKELELQGYTCMLSGSALSKKRPLSRKDVLSGRYSNMYVPKHYAFWIGIRDYAQSKCREKLKLNHICWSSYGEWFAVWSANDIDEAKIIGKYDPRIRFVYVDKIDERKNKNENSCISSY